MQNDKIKEYWEGEAGIYSEGIKAELKSETAENWKNLILEYAPEKEHLEVLDVGCGPGFFEIMPHKILFPCGIFRMANLLFYHYPGFVQQCIYFCPANLHVEIQNILRSGFQKKM